MQKQKLQIKMSVGYDEAVAYMEDLLKSLKQGKVVLQKGEEFVSMTPSDQVFIEVGAKAKKDRKKFSFEISWTECDDSDMKITHNDPIPIPDTVPAEKAESAPPATKPESTVPAKALAQKSAKAPAKAGSGKKTAPKKAAGKKAPPKKPASKKSAPKKAASSSNARK